MTSSFNYLIFNFIFIQEKVESDKIAANHDNKVKYYKSHRLSHLKDEKLARTIRKHVIFANKKLVVINKPYGVASHGLCLNISI